MGTDASSCADFADTVCGFLPQLLPDSVWHFTRVSKPHSLRSPRPIEEKGQGGGIFPLLPIVPPLTSTSANLRSLFPSFPIPSSPRGLQGRLHPTVGHRQAVLGLQLLMEVQNIAVRVARPGQGQDLLDHRQGHPPGRGSPGPAVKQTVIAPLLVARLPAPHLPIRDP